MLKAIDTKYKGYKFRSRLEARWAVYFDAIGLEWEYEKEGFEFDDGTRYLPDFWLPQVRCWAEVKACKLTTQERYKVNKLAKENYPVILLVGVPNTISYEVIEYEGDVSGWCDCIISMYHNYPIDENRFYTMTGYEIGSKVDVDFFPDVYEAVDKVRSARFEFGENGE